MTTQIKPEKQLFDMDFFPGYRSRAPVKPSISTTNEARHDARGQGWRECDEVKRFLEHLEEARRFLQEH